jgi:hypothetical protein
MLRHERGSRPVDHKKSPSNRQFGDDSKNPQALKHGRKGRKQWQQEKQLLKQLDPKALDEYLLDNE